MHLEFKGQVYDRDIHLKALHTYMGETTKRMNVDKEEIPGMKPEFSNIRSEIG